jgi:hypothetical protein
LLERGFLLTPDSLCSGRILVTKVPESNPQNCDMTPYMKRLAGWAQCSHQGLYKRKKNLISEKM